MPSERDKAAGGGGDGKLDGALGDLDGQILSERDVIKKRSNETAGSGGGSVQSAQNSSATADSGGGADASAAEPGGAVGGIPSNRSAPPAPNPVASASVPSDIPDAHDDDIIARQLREAAMKETDPELKKKLWDEYRKYKGI